MPYPPRSRNTPLALVVFAGILFLAWSPEPGDPAEENPPLAQQSSEQQDSDSDVDHPFGRHTGTIHGRPQHSPETGSDVDEEGDDEQAETGHQSGRYTTTLTPLGRRATPADIQGSDPTDEGHPFGRHTGTIFTSSDPTPEAADAVTPLTEDAEDEAETSDPLGHTGTSHEETP